MSGRKSPESARSGPPKGYRGTLAERFEKKNVPEPNSGCSLWFGACDQGGYGQLRVDGRCMPATHIALELAGRPVPVGMRACHRCDNPPCVNADHLFVGDQIANVADMIAKGRSDFSGLELGRGYQKHRAHCRHGHAWAPETTAIRKNKQGETYRECRICGRAQRQASKKRRRQG